MIVDGQQRLTSLWAVMKGQPVVTDKNDRQLIRISFNPLREEFAVADAARENDPEWLTSITEIWTSPDGVWAFTNQFISQLAAARELTAEEQQQIGANLGKLAGLTNYQFSAVDLSSGLDIAEVAEIFVRINSKNIPFEQCGLHPHVDVGPQEGSPSSTGGLRT